jgi:hypothetical protein
LTIREFTMVMAEFELRQVAVKVLFADTVMDTVKAGPKRERTPLSSLCRQTHPDGYTRLGAQPHQIIQR